MPGRITVLLTISLLLLGIGVAAVDLDDDGLRNFAEIRGGTHPLLADTSDDGIGDGTAVRFGLDPRKRYPEVFVSSFRVIQYRYPEYSTDFVEGFLRSGPSPGTLTTFEERQLEQWIDAPPEYRTAIVSGGYFHLDDWDKDGGVQTFPNGTAGPDSMPFEPNDADGDGILHWYYNSDGAVYDPITGICMGFNASEDRVGELGGCNGSGGLFDMGARPNRFDVFIQIDYMTWTNHSNRPRPQAIQRIKRTLAEQDISAHVVVGERLPHVQTTDNHTSGPELHQTRLEPSRRGVFVHGIFVHDVVVDQDGIKQSVGGYRAELPNGRGFFLVGWKSEMELSATMYIDSLVDWQAYVTLHELGHVGGLEHADSSDSVMGPPAANGTLEYTGHERRQFKTMFGRLPYYEAITADERDSG